MEHVMMHHLHAVVYLIGVDHFVIKDYCGRHQPCLNNGICRNLNSSYSKPFNCSCTRDFTGEYCEVSKIIMYNSFVKLFIVNLFRNMSLTYLLTLLPPALSSTIIYTCLQFIFILFMSLPNSKLNVFLGPPLFRFPSRFQVSSCLLM
ncbi:Jagged, partial [Schistosoma mansoni]|uniref:Jagged n=1 Tax=Schistosoma mansoni TaxID=6183 RepID=UPI00022DC40A